MHVCSNAVARGGIFVHVPMATSRSTFGAMYFPAFWARGRAGSASVWRWSDVSVADAQRDADARAVELERLFASGQRLDRYGYFDRPVREEVLEQHPGLAITRNVYGAQILNAANAMFVDIDFADDPTREPPALDRLRTWSSGHGLATRVYRTAAGLRALVTNHTFDPKADATAALLHEVGCDPLYVRLCQVQISFRARLTAKPWRIALRPPSMRWPYDDPDMAERFQAWLASYEAASASVAACRFIEAIGPALVDPAIAPVLAVHDARACGTSRLA